MMRKYILISFLGDLIDNVYLCGINNKQPQMNMELPFRDFLVQIKRSKNEFGHISCWYPIASLHFNEDEY